MGVPGGPRVVPGVSGSVEKYVEKWKVEGLKKLIITGINYASYLED